MAKEVQNRVLDLIEEALGTQLIREVSPDWLNRPGSAECGTLWPTVQSIYTDLTEADLPDTMPPRESRSIDAVMTDGTGLQRIVEVDEAQHFSPMRARTLALYPDGTVTAFDRELWATRSAATTKLRGGGWGGPRPPLFPDLGGRHLQRAFRDALADLLPGAHGWGPTLRIGDFEVSGWLHQDGAIDQMKSLLAGKGAL